MDNLFLSLVVVQSGSVSEVSLGPSGDLWELRVPGVGAVRAVGPHGDEASAGLLCEPMRVPTIFGEGGG